MASEASTKPNSRSGVILRSRRTRYLLAIAVLLGALNVIQTFLIYPFIKTFLETTLANTGVRLAHEHLTPKVLWSIFPPTITVTNIHVEIRNYSQEFPYPVELHLDNIQYRIEAGTSRRSSFTIPNDKSPEIVNFSSISWSNFTVAFYDPHPRPRISLMDGVIDLYSISLHQATKEMLSRLISRAGGTSHTQNTLLGVSISKIGITTHSVTSIPVSITHPTVSRLMNSFPAFFNLFTAPPISTSDDQPPAHPIVNPPHLSLFAPSLIFPAVYQGISSFRQAAMPSDHKTELGTETYRIPTPFSRIHAEVNLKRQGTRRIQHLSLVLVDEGPNPKYCTSLNIAQVDAIELSGRDSDGRGGCCTFRARKTGNYVSPIISNTSTPAQFEALSTKIFEYATAVVKHPFYIAAYALSLRDFLSNNAQFDLCLPQHVVQYHIAELEWMDETPKTTSTVARALAHVHNGFLNLFEDAVSLVG